jgi:hypothetical protein
MQYKYKQIIIITAKRKKLHSIKKVEVVHRFQICMCMIGGEIINERIAV